MLIEQEGIERLITESLTRELDKNEKLRLDEWLGKSLQNQNQFDIVHNIKVKGFSNIDVCYRDEVFSDVLLKINRIKQRNLILKYFSGIASVIIVIVLTSALFYKLGEQKANAQIVEVTTPKGIKTTVHLSDGSIIVMNSNSKLRYPTKFTGKNREVSFSGEGYFQVAKDNKHSFYVKTNHQMLRVFGTRFNLKAYQNDKLIETTLEEGSVAVTGISTDTNPVYLKPGEQSVLDKSSGKIKIVTVDPSRIISWQEDKYYFKSKSFEDIAHILERKFDVQIIIQSESLKKTVFTGDFVRGENLDQILNIIRKITNIKYKRNGQTVIISE